MVMSVRLSIDTSHISTRKMLGAFSQNLKKAHSSTGEHNTLVHLVFIPP
jgi:hypothetical protein